MQTWLNLSHFFYRRRWEPNWTVANFAAVAVAFAVKVTDISIKNAEPNVSWFVAMLTDSGSIEVGLETEEFIFLPEKEFPEAEIETFLHQEHQRQQEKARNTRLCLK